MRIGELADRTGASVRSIRHYEARGLLDATRTDAGQRVFDESAVERVRTIRMLLAGGLNVRTIGELLPCLESGPDDRNGHLERRLGEEIERVDDDLAALADARSVLVDVLTAAERARRTG
ncbi:MAG: MerR family transcriptional regulator [Actinomycetota bacterium]